MNDEKQEKWLQRIMALIWLIIICCFIFNAVKKYSMDSATKSDAQTEQETVVPTEVTAE